MPARWVNSVRCPSFQGIFRAQTKTMPLHVDILYNEYQLAAFAVTSLLALLALVTLVIKAYVEWRASQLHGRDEKQ